MWPLPVVPGLTTVHRISQLASGPPTEDGTVRLFRLCTSIVATSVLFGPLASEAPVRSRLLGAAVRVPFAGYTASPVWWSAASIVVPGPHSWLTEPTEVSRL